MRLLLLITFISFSHTSIAQKKEVIKSWSAGLTTNVAIPGSAYVALQPCAELQFQNRVSVVAGYSFKFIDVDKSEESITNEKYGRFLLEGRYRLTKRENKAAFYTSLQFTQSRRKFTQEDGYFLYEYDDDSTTYFTKADATSPVTTFSLQMGLNSRGAKRFYFDIFFGLGVRLTNTRYYNIEGRHRALNFQPVPFNWDTGIEMARPSVLFHLPAGLRLFYRIK
jgi:hypothetical protein